MSFPNDSDGITWTYSIMSDSESSSRFTHNNNLKKKKLEQELKKETIVSYENLALAAWGAQLEEVRYATQRKLYVKVPITSNSSLHKINLKGPLGLANRILRMHHFSWDKIFENIPSSDLQRFFRVFQLFFLYPQSIKQTVTSWICRIGSANSHKFFYAL